MKRWRCQASHGPAATASGSSVSTSIQPYSGFGVGPTAPPRTAARIWPPEHSPSDRDVALDRLAETGRASRARTARRGRSSGRSASRGRRRSRSRPRLARASGARRCRPRCRAPRTSRRAGPRGERARLEDQCSHPRAMRSASSSGIASATCSVAGRDLGLLAGAGQVDVPVDDRVLEPAEPVDLDRDDVAGLHRARVGRRAGEDHVAGLERDQPAEVGELVGDAQIRSSAVVSWTISPLRNVRRWSSAGRSRARA